jgi:hypothetical protein
MYAVSATRAHTFVLKRLAPRPAQVEFDAEQWSGDLGNRIRPRHDPRLSAYGNGAYKSYFHDQFRSSRWPSNELAVPVTGHDDVHAETD